MSPCSSCDDSRDDTDEVEVSSEPTEGLAVIDGMCETMTAAGPRLRPGSTRGRCKLDEIENESDS